MVKSYYFFYILLIYILICEYGCNCDLILDRSCNLMELILLNPDESYWKFITKNLLILALRVVMNKVFIWIQIYFS